MADVIFSSNFGGVAVKLHSDVWGKFVSLLIKKSQTYELLKAALQFLWCPLVVFLLTFKLLSHKHVTVTSLRMKHCSSSYSARWNLVEFSFPHLLNMAEILAQCRYTTTVNRVACRCESVDGILTAPNVFDVAIQLRRSSAIIIGQAFGRLACLVVQHLLAYRSSIPGAGGQSSPGLRRHFTTAKCRNRACWD